MLLSKSHSRKFPYKVNLNELTNGNCSKCQCSNVFYFVKHNLFCLTDVSCVPSICRECKHIDQSILAGVEKKLDILRKLEGVLK